MHPGRLLLTYLVVLPLLAALVVLFTPRQYARAIRGISVGAMLAELVLSGRLLFDGFRLREFFVGLNPFDFRPSFPLTTEQVWSQVGFHFVERVHWVREFGISYKLGVDGISLWLVLLTTLLSPIALYASWQSIDTKIKEYAIAFLLLEVGMVGSFIALDLFLFYVFWELMLVPMYLIIGVWGGKDRIYAAVKFFLFTMVGSLLMLIAILYMVAQYKALSGHYSFDYEQLARLQLPHWPQYLCFGAFGLAFAIKVPVFPFHTWLPDAHVQAPTGGSVILAAVLLKMGTYGFLRFAMPFFPVASHILGPTFAIFMVIGIIYGAFAAWAQRDVKKLVAYSSVSHLGFVMLGLFSLTPQGISGALLQMVNHGISTGALFLLVGVIYDRRHTRDLEAFGGLAKSMPVYAVFFVIITMSSIGLPGTNGFVGEFMILNGAFSSDVLPDARIFALFSTLGVVLAAVYMLHAVLKMFWGPLDKQENRDVADMNRRELTVLVPLVLLVFAIGFFPSPLLRRMQPSVDAFIETYIQKRTVSQELVDAQLAPDPYAPAPTDGEPLAVGAAAAPEAPAIQVRVPGGAP